MLESWFYDLAFDAWEIALQGFSEPFLSGFGKLCHPSVTSGDVGGMWMSPTLEEYVISDSDSDDENKEWRFMSYMTTLNQQFKKVLNKIRSLFELDVKFIYSVYLKTNEQYAYSASGK